MIEVIHKRRNLPPWLAKENQLPCVHFSQYHSLRLTVSRCLEHVVNLANGDIMSHITKVAVMETTQAIWEYDPTLEGNTVLGGNLDVIAAIRTIALKVSCYRHLGVTTLTHLLDTIIWSADTIF